ncbi:MAG TPA: AraC family transcriptional regulator, partial [Bryobacteraceae bacterium]|nr:AraC family transcriptional regulator [Bryobacteraceae bacterium]
ASDGRLMGMARELVDELETARPGLDLAVQALVTLILVHVLRYSIEPTLLSRAPLLAPQLPTWQLNRALRYLSSHDKSSFSLPELCADIGSSPSRFIPLFKNSTGLTPYAYFNKLILYRAAAQFQQPNRSVKEVAYELGFRNASHFCRFVRQIAGHTPTSLPRQSADDGVFNPLKLPWQHFADHL